MVITRESNREVLFIPCFLRKAIIENHPSKDRMKQFSEISLKKGYRICPFFANIGQVLQSYNPDIIRGSNE
jgi:hypothetical protein